MSASLAAVKRLPDSYWIESTDASEPRPQKGWRPACAAGLPAILAFALRWFHLTRAYDVFVDEITYLRVGQSIARSGVPMLYGHPFYLHPPGFFWLEAAWLEVAGVGGGVIHQVHAMRLLNVLLAAATAAVIVLLGRGMAGVAAGVVAALLFALDPFAIRFDSRVLLETMTMLLVLAGYAMLVRPLAERATVTSERAVLAGLVFGMAIATKDVAVFLTIVPLVGCIALNWVLPRRTAVLAMAAALIPYLAAALPTVVSGHFDEALAEKSLGLQRLLGVVQITGFNAEGAPSFVATVAHNAASFGTTYLFLALSPLPALLLMRRRRPDHRLLGMLMLSSMGLLAYVVLVGTLEEQTFYFLSVLSGLGVSVLGAEMVQRCRSRGRAGCVAALAMLLSAVLLFDVAAWEATRFSRDDGYAQLVGWMDGHVAHGARVFATTETAAFVLPMFDIRPIASPQDVRAEGVRYVVTSTKQTNDGYASVTPAFVDWVERNGRLLFTFSGRSNGDLVLYELEHDPVWSQLPQHL